MYTSPDFSLKLSSVFFSGLVFPTQNFLLPKKQQQPQQIVHALKIPIHKPQFMGGDGHIFVATLYAWGDSRRTGSTLNSSPNFSMVSKISKSPPNALFICFPGFVIKLATFANSNFLNSNFVTVAKKPNYSIDFSGQVNFFCFRSRLVLDDTNAFMDSLCDARPPNAGEFKL